MQHHYEGHWKGRALKIETALPFKAPKKSRFPGPTPSNAPSKDVPRLKTIKYKCHLYNRYIGNFMYMSVVALLCVVVFRYVGIVEDCF
jgi:hypothetical protein